MYRYCLSASLPITAIIIWRISAVGDLTETWIICHLLAISYGAQWLSHNSSLVTYDPDFLEAVGKVKRTMLGLATVLLAQVAAYMFLNGLPSSILDLFGLE